MNGFSKKASRPAKPSSKTEPLFELPVVCRMLPLIQRIAQEIADTEHRLGILRGEQDRLERQRRNLEWPERKRRYQIQEEITDADKRRRNAVSELEGLGVALVDGELGLVGFPTIVNNKLAFFSWMLGEDTVKFWHYGGDEGRRRTIPDSWSRQTPARAAGKRSS